MNQQIPRALLRLNVYFILKKYYKQYCKILANVIKEAKKYTYNNQINNSTNKIKTTWNIIKTETKRHKRSTATTLLRYSTIIFWQ
jgi:capsular polysaccharide biosynthesis protein